MDILIICAVLAGLSFVAVCLFTILALVQITRTVKEAEEAAKKINIELGMINDVSQKALDFGQKVASPIVSVGGIVLYALKILLKKDQ